MRRSSTRGRKIKLRPIYDELLKLGKSLGDDVKACPCKTIVPLYREHVFAQIKPTTNSRIDLGLALAHFNGCHWVYAVWGLGCQNGNPG